MTTKAKSQETPPSDLAVRSLSPLERKLDFIIERVNKRTAIEDSDTHGEDVYIDLIRKDGFENPQAEFDALFAQFGLTAYADKSALAAEGTRFRLSRVVTRNNGGYNGDDDWGVTIVTEHGEPQMLTFESNPGRDRFLTMMAYYISRRGVTDFCRLVAYPNAKEQIFYVINPARNAGPTYKTVRQLAEDGVTIEQTEELA